jgi:hypothetical protein
MSSSSATIDVEVNATNQIQRQPRIVHCGVCGGEGHTSVYCNDSRIRDSFFQMIGYATFEEAVIGLKATHGNNYVNLVAANFHMPSKWGFNGKHYAIKNIFDEIKRIGVIRSSFSTYLQTTNQVEKSILKKIIIDVLKPIVENHLRTLQTENIIRMNERRAQVERAQEAIAQRRAERQRFLQIAMQTRREMEEIEEKVRTARVHYTRRIEQDIAQIKTPTLRAENMKMKPRIIRRLVSQYRAVLMREFEAARSAARVEHEIISVHSETANYDIRDEECSICYEELNKQNCVMFTCSHQFCFTCVKTSMIKAKLDRTRNTCAMCRVVVGKCLLNPEFVRVE